MNLKEKIRLLLPQTKLIPSCWYLTFGLPHIGLGILSRALRDENSNLVFDTGLFNALKFPPPLDYIRFNRKKHYAYLINSFLSHNIKEDFTKKKLIFQESLLDYDLYTMLVENWGEPTAAFSLTTDYGFFKKKYFEKKPGNTQDECKRVFDLCTQTLSQVPSNILSIDRAISLSEFEKFMSRKISKRDSNRNPCNIFDF